jgi:hypothetical protein
MVGLISIPIAIAIAILRYRLYDIDRIVSNAIGYGIVTIVLSAIFVTVNLVLIAVFSRVVTGFEGNGIAVAAATLVAAALFTPVRRRVQGIVDHRFHRARYDAERTVVGSAARLRDEVTSSVARGHPHVASRTVEPTGAYLWLRRDMQVTMGRIRGPSRIARCVAPRGRWLRCRPPRPSSASSSRSRTACPTMCLRPDVHRRDRLRVVGARVVDVGPGTRSGGSSLAGLSQVRSPRDAGNLVPPGSVVPVGAALAAWISSWIWIPGAGMLLVFVPLLFPSGRSLSGRWHRFAVGMAILAALDTVLHAIGTLPHLDDVAALIAYDATKGPGVIGALIGLAEFWYFGSFVGVACVVIRLRRSVGIERQQIRWYAIAIAIASVAIIVQGSWLEVGGPLLLLTVTVIPASIGIAMLRYRLYELDRLVSRSIGTRS